MCFDKFIHNDLLVLLQIQFFLKLSIYEVLTLLLKVQLIIDILFTKSIY